MTVVAAHGTTRVLLQRVAAAHDCYCISRDMEVATRLKNPLVVACELHCVPLDKSREEKGSTTLGLSPKQQVFGCTKDGRV